MTSAILLLVNQFLSNYTSHVFLIAQLTEHENTIEQ